MMTDASTVNGVTPGASGLDILAFSTASEIRGYLMPGYGSGGDVPAVSGWWIDETPSVNIHRFRDRVFIGDAVKYNGRRNSPYGGSALNTRGASWVEKHGRLIVSDDEGHIALLTSAHIADDVVAGDSMGMASGHVIINEGVGTFGRAVYIEVMHKGAAGGTSGVELQCGNYTDRDPSVINAYSAGNQQASAFYIGAESGTNYQVGDANTNITTPTYACGAVMDISGGSLNAIYQKFKAGFVFRDTALYRDIDGFTGNAVAVGMAKGHEITWAGAANMPKQAKIRSDISATSGADVGLIFKDSTVQITGANEAPIVQFVSVANMANSLQFVGAASGSTLKVNAVGANADLTIDIKGKGTGGVRLLDGANGARVNVNTNGVGFNGATPGKPTITGSRGGNAALTSLLTALAGLGLIVNSTTT